DYVVLGPNGSVKAYRHVSGANWDLLPITAPGSSQWTPEQVRFADLDGDGKADYLVLGENGSVKAYRHISGANWDLLPITASGSPQWNPEQVRI
ncbi:FG-GAP-like repeat-containing protein, partial [Streptomyces sp. NPDC006798]|uniref:FG-GAP-like repeat-containing protein n=1 Tax=Streptomyces sp. NPDC006798 TaxID=3155462 RepID=UPI003401C330